MNFLQKKAENNNDDKKENEIKSKSTIDPEIFKKLTKTADKMKDLVPPSKMERLLREYGANNYAHMNPHAFYLLYLLQNQSIMLEARKSGVIFPHTVFFDSVSNMWFWCFSSPNEAKIIPFTFLKLRIFFAFFCFKGRRDTTSEYLIGLDGLMDIARPRDLKNYYFLIKLQVKEQSQIVEKDIQALVKELVVAKIQNKRRQENMDYNQRMAFFENRENERKNEYNIHHLAYPSYEVSYYYFANFEMVKKILRGPYSYNLKAIYSHDVTRKRLLYFRVNVVVEDLSHYLFKLEILQISAKSEILTDEMWEDILENKKLYPSNFDQYKYFTRSRNKATNEKLAKIAKFLVRQFWKVTHFDLSELTFIVMLSGGGGSGPNSQDFEPQKISILEILEIVVNHENSKKILDKKHLIKILQSYEAEPANVDVNYRDNFLMKIKKKRHHQVKKKDPDLSKANLDGLDPSEERDLRLKKLSEINAKKCQGLYCFELESLNKTFIDEKDETNNIYLMESELKTFYKIDYKSIILDFVEQQKALDRVSNATGWGLGRVRSLVQGLLLKFRKFYTMHDLLNFELFDHLHYVHVYHQKTVCATCNAMYSRINGMREKSQDKYNIYLEHPNRILHEINRYQVEVGSAIRTKGKKKVIFSEKFYKILKKFDRKKKPSEDHELALDYLDPNERHIYTKRLISRERNLRFRKRFESKSQPIYKYLEKLKKKKKGSMHKKKKDKKVGEDENEPRKARSPKSTTSIPTPLSQGMGSPKAVDNMNTISFPILTLKKGLKSLFRKRFTNASSETQDDKRGLSGPGNIQNSLNLTDNKRTKSLVKNRRKRILGHIFKKHKAKLHPRLSKIYQSSLKMHLGTNKEIKVDMKKGSVTTKTSLNLSKLNKKFEKLKKVADKNKGGNIGREKDEFLELIMCDYKGKFYGEEPDLSNLESIGYKIKPSSTFDTDKKKDFVDLEAEKPKKGTRLLDKNRLYKFIRDREILKQDLNINEYTSERSRLVMEAKRFYKNKFRKETKTFLLKKVGEMQHPYSMQKMKTFIEKNVVVNVVERSNSRTSTNMPSGPLSATFQRKFSGKKRNSQFGSRDTPLLSVGGSPVTGFRCKLRSGKTRRAAFERSSVKKMSTFVMAVEGMGLSAKEEMDINGDHFWGVGGAIEDGDDDGSGSGLAGVMEETEEEEREFEENLLRFYPNLAQSVLDQYKG